MKTCVSYKLHLFVLFINVLAQVNAFPRLRLRHKSPLHVDQPPRVVKKEDDGKVRPVEVGDAVVPGDFVQIAERLMDKIPYRGRGKGIVSSAKNPPALADTLFKRFFFTQRKMIILRPMDIGGLNALQALALSGEEVKGDTAQHEYMTVTTPAPHTEAAFMPPKRCRYLLLLKNRPKRSKKLRNKLSKKESTSNSSHSNQSKNDTTSTTKINDPIKVEKQASPHPGVKLVHRSPKEKCHWMYECANDGMLDSCNIHPLCERQRPNVEKQLLAIKHKEDEHTKLIKRFRRMLGVTLVDEEVEKIIEIRYYHLKNPLVKHDDRTAMKQDDSISQYYGSLMLMQHAETTTASNREVIEENEVIDLELDIAEEPSVDDIEQNSPRTSTGIDQNEAREAKLMLAKRHLRPPKQTTVSPHA